MSTSDQTKETTTDYEVAGDQDKQTQHLYNVVINHEEQYSLWPAHRDPPEGWQRVGQARSREECLAYIEEVWTDMRPLSLRIEMDQFNRP